VKLLKADGRCFLGDAAENGEVGRRDHALRRIPEQGPGKLMERAEQDLSGAIEVGEATVAVEDGDGIADVIEDADVRG